MMQAQSWMYTRNKGYAVPRPATVTLISLLQFAKAAVVLFVAGRTLHSAGICWGSTTLWQTFFVITNGRIGPVYLAPVIAIYSYAVGSGLWLLHKWARKALMLSTSVNAVFWSLALAAGTTFQQNLGAHFSMSGFSQQSVFMLVYVDIFIFLALAWGRDIPEAFAQFS